ncbi:MAG: autotransporter outer membrane beta-barrel domain-containing protein, partial [Thermoguttaceae bacterium]|nr:autotransporter outer membrane beta-barrel domain-containing protein [Thermoguttaceae bacterium]
KTRNHTVGVYHQFGDEHVYNIATLRAGYDIYNTQRNVSFLGEVASPAAKYRGWNVGASYERGANFDLEPFVLTPYISGDYNYLNRRGFTETNGGSFALKASKSKYHSLRANLGVVLALHMYPGSQHISVSARAGYTHEFFNGMRGKTDLEFTSLSGTPFTITGNNLGRDWGLLGLGLQWDPIPALAVFYEGDVVTNKYTKDAYSQLGLKLRW